MMIKNNQKKALASRLDAKKRMAICNEVRAKIKDYETRMAYRLPRWVEVAELFSGRTQTNKENFKLNPNSAELYKAVRATANMVYRMTTSQRPLFELMPLDIIGHRNPANLVIAKHYIDNQLDLAKFYNNYFRALMQLYLYGSVAIHNPYEPVRRSFFGEPRYVTSYKPISLINTAFAIDGYDIQDCAWIALSDVEGPHFLQNILRMDKSEQFYSHSAINDALAMNQYKPEINVWVQQRLMWAGYTNFMLQGGCEHNTYYGPLDCMDDGEEYEVEVVNREHLIRCEAFQGLRPVRVATFNNIDIEPLGNGIGEQFRPLLGQIDDTRSSLANTVLLAGANMMAKQKAVSDEDSEFVIRNFGIMELENPDALRPISPLPATIQMLSGYNADLIQQFRQASGAPDTLQAVVQGDSSTATEVSLAMNEAVRNDSVQAEMISTPLIKDYIKMIVQNAQKYQTQPMTLNVNGTPLTVPPIVFKMDVDVTVKTMTDQDFRPAKITKLMTAMQVMIQAQQSAAAQGIKYDISPLIMESLRLLDVPDYEKSVQPITEQDLMRQYVQSQMQNGPQPQGSVDEEGNSAQSRMENQRAGRREERTVNRLNESGATETMSTPTGQVLAPQGDANMSLAAQRSASVGTGKVELPPRR